MNRFSTNIQELLMYGSKELLSLTGDSDIVAMADLGGIDDSVFNGPVRSFLRSRLGFLETHDGQWDGLVFLFICFLEHLNDDEVDELVLGYLHCTAV